MGSGNRKLAGRRTHCPGIDRPRPIAPSAVPELRFPIPESRH